MLIPTQYKRLPQLPLPHHRQVQRTLKNRLMLLVSSQPHQWLTLLLLCQQQSILNLSWNGFVGTGMVSNGPNGVNLERFRVG